ncbi:MAG TPA: NUDIX hydrolase [Ktedonobacterales bacterium]|nr:NUDIX hydrolase [Ktedonobacterales bacterium]
MRVGVVRPIALCVFRDDNDRILVLEGYDPTRELTFYRPLGGGIEFGERSQDTVAREIREELELDVLDLEFVGTLENVFTYDGLPGHEIALVYEGAFLDQSVYSQPYLLGTEDDGTPITAVWKPLDAFRTGAAPLYPDGLLELLDGN